MDEVRQDVGLLVLAPLNAPEFVWDGLPRQIMMWLDFDRPTPRKLFSHLRACGYEIPAWMRQEGELKALDHVPSKGTRCVLVYRAMIENWLAGPSPVPHPTLPEQLPEDGIGIGEEG